MKKIFAIAFFTGLLSVSYASPYDLIHLKIVDAGPANTNITCSPRSADYGFPTKDLGDVELMSGQSFEADILPATIAGKKLVTLNMSCTCYMSTNSIIFHLGSYSDDKVTATWITQEPYDAPPPYIYGNMSHISDANSTTVTETVTTCEGK